MTRRGLFFHSLVSGCFCGALAGILDVKLANNYTPTVGHQFEILAAGSLTGAFSSMTGLNLPNGLLLRVDVGGSKVVIVVTQP